MSTPLVADRVQETTSTTGTTSPVNLGGAVTGFRTFASAFTTGSVVYYCLNDGTNWEVGSGAYTSGSPGTVARTTIYASSNSNAIVNFPGPTTSIFSDAPAVFFQSMVTLTDTQVLTNKSYVARVASTASNLTPTPVCDTTDEYILTALAGSATFGIPTYTIAPTNGQALVIRIKDNGSAQALAWTIAGAGSYRPVGLTLPTATIVGKTLYVGLIYNSDDSYWDMVAVIEQ